MSCTTIHLCNDTLHGLDVVLAFHLRVDVCQFHTGRSCAERVLLLVNVREAEQSEHTWKEVDRVQGFIISIEDITMQARKTFSCAHL